MEEGPELGPQGSGLSPELSHFRLGPSPPPLARPDGAVSEALQPSEPPISFFEAAVHVGKVCLKLCLLFGDEAHRILDPLPLPFGQGFLLTVLGLVCVILAQT